MMTTKEFRSFLRKHSSQIKISVTLAAISTFVGIIAGRITNPRLAIEVTIGTVIVLLLLGILFNLSKLISLFIKRLGFPPSFQIVDLFQRDLYWERQKHFTKEKEKLAEILVTKSLPRILKSICKDCPHVSTVNIILDSGTTITPIFTEMMCNGIESYKDHLEYVIYTNNLAGVDEIRKLDPTICKLDERSFNIIGGKPLNIYRATTGDTTQQFLETIWNRKLTSNGKIINLGILTANWFTCGPGFKNLSLCAKGEGHFEFKRVVAINSDYLILVAPLGKLLPLENEKLLNDLVPKDPGQRYERYEIPPERKEKTYLLTTFRPEHTWSPLLESSMHLQNILAETSALNYLILPDCPMYNPEGDKYKVVVTELPHQYVRENYSKVFFSKLG